MSDDLKNLLLVLEGHLEEMYDCFTQDETNLALFHMGAMQALVSHYMAKHGFNRASNSSDQNCVRGQSHGALAKEAQTSQGATIPCSCIPQIQTVGSLPAGASVVVQSSTAQPGQRQFTIFNEMGTG